MPRPKEHNKTAVMAAITEHLNLNGPSNWDELMPRFPDVSRATFFRWVREAKEAIESAAAAHGTTALKLAQKRIRSSVETPEHTRKQLKAQLPVAPSPAIVADMPGELAAQTFDFMAYFHKIVADADLVRSAAVTKNEDGTEKAKNPVLLDNNIRRRLGVIETWLHSMELVWNLEKMQELYRLVIEEVGKADPDTQRAILARLPEGEPRYDADAFTDRSERFLVAELVREQLMRQLGEELPYATSVEVERFEDRPDGVVEIHAVVWVEREGQKAIVIGAGGRRAKAIGSMARRGIESLLGRKVFLKLWVRVRAGWSDDEAALRQFGYE